MARDTDKQIQDRKSDLLDQEMEKFLQGAVGRQYKPQGNTWISQKNGRRF